MLLLSILSVLAHDHHHQPVESHQVPSIMVARGSLAPLASFTPFPLRELGNPFIIHRIVRSRDSCPCERPHRQLADPEGNATAESWGWFAGKVLMLLILVGLAGAAGFYFGKVNESRNYVRVPPMN